MITRNDTDRIPEADKLHRLAKDCYQCGKCSAGCPVAEAMEPLPHQLLRLVQLGRLEEAATSPASWVCVSCLTCAARCPQQVDSAAVMDGLRQWAIRHDCVADSQRPTWLFQQAFLENIRRHGRLDETELIMMFKLRVFAASLRAGHLFRDLTLVPRLMRRRKFRLMGRRVRDREVVRRIVDRCLAEPAGLERE